jgi:hypothetical protein
LDDGTKSLLKQSWESYKATKDAAVPPSKAVAKFEQDLDKRAKRLATLEDRAKGLQLQLQKLLDEQSAVQSQIVAEQAALEAAKREAKSEFAQRVGLPKTGAMELELQAWQAVASRMDEGHRKELLQHFEAAKTALEDERAKREHEARVQAEAAAAAALAAATPPTPAPLVPPSQAGHQPPTAAGAREASGGADEVVDSIMAGISDDEDLSVMLSDPEKRKKLEAILESSKKPRVEAKPPVGFKSAG